MKEAEVVLKKKYQNHTIFGNISVIKDSEEFKVLDLKGKGQLHNIVVLYSESNHHILEVPEGQVVVGKQIGYNPFSEAITRDC